MFSCRPQRVNPFIPEFDKIIDVGQAGHRIGIEFVLAEHVVFFRQDGNFFHTLRNIRIVQYSQFRSVRHGHPFTHRVNIVIPVLMPGTEDHVVSAAVMGKLIADMGHIARVIRMHPLKPSAD